MFLSSGLPVYVLTCFITWLFWLCQNDSVIFIVELIWQESKFQISVIIIALDVACCNFPQVCVRKILCMIVWMY